LTDNRRVEIPLALLPHDVRPYLALMVIGFAIAIFGHIGKSNFLVGIGIAVIFFATLLLPLAIIATNPTPERPAPNAFPPGER
jgi:hypothetical protein